MVLADEFMGAKAGVSYVRLQGVSSGRAVLERLRDSKIRGKRVSVTLTSLESLTSGIAA